MHFSFLLYLILSFKDHIFFFQLILSLQYYLCQRTLNVSSHEFKGDIFQWIHLSISTETTPYARTNKSICKTKSFKSKIDHNHERYLLGTWRGDPYLDASLNEILARELLKTSYEDSLHYPKPSMTKPARDYMLLWFSKLLHHLNF